MKKPKTKAGKKAKVAKVMGEYKRGTLHSGSKHGPLASSPEQAIAIALSQSGQSRKGRKRTMKPKKSAIKGKGIKD